MAAAWVRQLPHGSCMGEVAFRQESHDHVATVRLGRGTCRLSLLISRMGVTTLSLRVVPRVLPASCGASSTPFLRHLRPFCASLVIQEVFVRQPPKFG